MATRSSILAWKTPWTEEPSGLQLQSVQGTERTLHPSFFLLTRFGLLRHSLKFFSY